MQNANGTSTAFRDLHGPQRYRNAVPIFVQTTISAFSAVSALPIAKTQAIPRIFGGGVAGGLGFEPRLAESESAVLPLDDPPSAQGGWAENPARKGRPRLLI